MHILTSQIMLNHEYREWQYWKRQWASWSDYVPTQLISNSSCSEKSKSKNAKSWQTCYLDTISQAHIPNMVVFSIGWCLMIFKVSCYDVFCHSGLKHQNSTIFVVFAESWHYSSYFKQCWSVKLVWFHILIYNFCWIPMNKSVHLSKGFFRYWSINQIINNK